MRQHLHKAAPKAAVKAALKPILAAALSIAAAAPASANGGRLQSWPDQPGWWPQPIFGLMRIQTVLGASPMQFEQCITPATIKEMQETADRLTKTVENLPLFGRLFKEEKPANCAVNWERPSANTFRRTEVCGPKSNVYELQMVAGKSYTTDFRGFENGQLTSQIVGKAEKIGEC